MAENVSDNAMSPVAVFIACLTFSLLTVAYVMGARTVRKTSPDNLVKFHFIMVAIRFIFAVTIVGIFTLFADNRQETMHFAALILVLYIVMIAVTLILKH